MREAADTRLHHHAPSRRRVRRPVSGRCGDLRGRHLLVRGPVRPRARERCRGDDRAGRLPECAGRPRRRLGRRRRRGERPERRGRVDSDRSHLRPRRLGEPDLLRDPAPRPARRRARAAAERCCRTAAPVRGHRARRSTELVAGLARRRTRLCTRLPARESCALDSPRGRGELGRHDSGACNAYAYAFSKVAVASVPGRDWAPFRSFRLFQGPGYRLRLLSGAAFVVSAR